MHNVNQYYNNIIRNRQEEERKNNIKTTTNRQNENNEIINRRRIRNETISYNRGDRIYIRFNGPINGLHNTERNPVLSIGLNDYILQNQYNSFNVCFFLLSCFIINLIAVGFGSLFLAVSQKKPFLIYISIFQAFIFYFCMACLIKYESIIFFNIEYSLFFFIYFIILMVIMFITSFYLGFVVYICFNDQKFRKYEKLHKKLFLIIYNIVVAGTGTLMYGLSKICKKQLSYWVKIRDILFGIIQLAGFILFLYAIVLLLINYNNKVRIIYFFIFGSLSYVFSIVSIIICFIEIK